MIYPYIHLSSTTKLLPKIVSENGKSEWIESGFYLELDHISNNHHTFSEQKIDYVIFIGVRIDNEALPSIIGELHFILRVCIIRNLKRSIFRTYMASLVKSWITMQRIEQL